MADQARVAARRAQDLRRLAALHRVDAPYYARLAAVAAGDPALLGLAAHLTPRRWAAGAQLVNALQFIAEDDPDLARYRPDQWRRDEPDEAAIRRCVRRRTDDVHHVLTTRRTQVNDVTAAPALRWLFGAAAESAGWSAIALMDIGAGAGLLTVADTYAARFHGERRGWSVPGARGPLDLVVSGAARPVPAVPVRWRRGIDLLPPPRTVADRRWLRSCLPADHTARVAALTAALATTTTTPWLLTGEVLARFDEVASSVPETAGLVVQSVGLVNQLSRSARSRLAAIMARTAANRPVAWVGLEPHRAAVGAMLAQLGCGWPAAPGSTADGPGADPLAFAALLGRRPALIAWGASARVPRRLHVAGHRLKGDR